MKILGKRDGPLNNTWIAVCEAVDYHFVEDRCASNVCVAKRRRHFPAVEELYVLLMNYDED